MGFLMATDMNELIRNLARGGPAADGPGSRNTDTSTDDQQQQQLHRSRTQRLADQLAARLTTTDNDGDHH